MKKFISLILAVLMMAAALPVCAESAATPEATQAPEAVEPQTLDIDQLGVHVTLAAGWVEALTNGAVTGYDDYDVTSAAEAFTHGKIVLAYMEDMSVLEGVSTRDEAVKIIDEKGIWLMDIAAVTTGTEYAGREGAPAVLKLGSAGNYDFYYQTPADASAAATTDEGKAAISGLMAALPAPAEFITLSEPVLETASSSADATASIPGLGAFSATDLNGNTVTSDVLKNAKLTMVNVWGTYCGPCINEMPVLQELAVELKDKGFQIIGIVSDATEGDEDTLASAKEIVAGAGSTYVHLIPDSVLSENVIANIYAVPTTVFVDAQGNILDTPTVGSNDKEGWLAIINPLLEKVG